MNKPYLSSVPKLVKIIIFVYIKKARYKTKHLA